MRAISLLFHDVYVAAPGESGFLLDAAHHYKLPLPAFDAQLRGIKDSRADLPVLATSLFVSDGARGGRGEDSTQRSQRITEDDSPADRAARGLDRASVESQACAHSRLLVIPRSLDPDAGHRPASAGERSSISSPRRSLCSLCLNPLRSLLALRPDDTRALPYLITFDDGGVSYYTVAAERLEARGWRGHCFVTTDQIGTPGFLDARQIRELDARGHIIGSHSASHPRRFSACTVEQMREEWSRSRRVLEDLLGHAVDIASVPGGFFSRTVALAARDAGIRVLFNSEPVTSIAAIDGCHVIGRFTIRRGDSPDAAGHLVMPAAWARSRAWVEWNAKGLIKPLLGPAYIRLADWMAARSPQPSS